MLQHKKFPDIPVSTREEARESRPHPKEPRFRLLAREEGSFPCEVGKEFPAFPSHLKRRRLHRKGKRNSRVLPPFPESPRCLSTFQGNLFSLHCLDFQAKDRLTPRWHLGQPCRKASWKSLVGMPRRKAPGPLIHAKGSCCYSSGGKRTCMPPLVTRTDYPGETPVVPQDPCQHWRGMFRFQHRIHTRSYAPASTGGECREAPELLAWGLVFPEATMAGP